MQTEEIVQRVPLARLQLSPLNPRKIQRGIDALAESIRTRGIDTPLIVRAVGDSYEIGDGSRRRLAAEKAGLADAPVLVRELDDIEMLELMLVSHAYGEHLHPLDEADGYASMTRLGYDIEGLALKVGRPVATVRRALRLLDLGEDARGWFAERPSAVDVAHVIARVPMALQRKLVAAIDEWGDGVAARDVADLVRREYTLRLDAAGFDLADATLDEQAGPCTTCPQRTSVQSELFAHLGQDDRCTDPGCFAGKREVTWDRLVKSAEAAGMKVLTKKETAAVFPYEGDTQPAFASGYIDLDGSIYVGSKQVSVAATLGTDVPEVFLARDPKGGPHKLVKRAAVEGRVRKGARAERAEPDLLGRPAAPDKAAKKAERERAKAEAEVELAQVAELAKAARLGAKAKPLPLLRLMGAWALRSAWPESVRRVAKAHALEKGEEPLAMLEQQVESGGLVEVWGLMFELALAERMVRHDTDAIADAGAALKVDLGKVEARVLAEKATPDEKAAAGERVTAAMRKPAKKAARTGKKVKEPA